MTNILTRDHYLPTVPDPVNGRRLYDNGRDREDINRCITAVVDKFIGPYTHQCKKKRGHGLDGLFCKQHSNYFKDLTRV